MKKECSVVQDVLPLYLENMVSEGTKVFVEEHLENCSDCTAEWERLKSEKQMDAAGMPQRERDVKVITAVKKKIAKSLLKAVAAVCLVFAALLSAVLLYTGISYPVTKDNILLSTKTDSEYSYIILENEAGKSHYFDSKTEDILNDRNEVCGQRIILYNVRYHNSFTKNTSFMSWGRALNDETPYMEVVVKLGNDTLRISNSNF